MYGLQMGNDEDTFIYEIREEDKANIFLLEDELDIQFLCYYGDTITFENRHDNKKGINMYEINHAMLDKVCKIIKTLSLQVDGG